jgi:hypothetical protein
MGFLSSLQKDLDHASDKAGMTTYWALLDSLKIVYGEAGNWNNHIELLREDSIVQELWPYGSVFAFGYIRPALEVFQIFPQCSFPLHKFYGFLFLSFSVSLF